MKTIKFIVIIFTVVLSSLNLKGQKSDKFGGNIFIQGKTFLVTGNPANREVAKDVTITIVEKKKNKRNARSFTARTGDFGKPLESDKNYAVYVSKIGYETKSLEISTVGAVDSTKYVIAFDILLKRKGFADYDGMHPVACIKHNDRFDFFDYNNCK